MRVLIVDDDQSRHTLFELRDETPEYFHAYGFDEAVRILRERSPFDVVHLDWDLLDSHGSGLSIVERIIKLPVKLRPKSVNCHSLNDIWRHGMANILRNHGIPATEREFGKLWE